MLEREDSDKRLDSLQSAIGRVKDDVRLEVMWNPSIADPNINLTDEQLDEFLTTFSVSYGGMQLESWITLGADCEASIHEDEREECKERAVGSVDFHGVTFEDSVLSCRNGIRSVYKNIMEESVKKNGLFPNLTINGKKLPKP